MTTKEEEILKDIEIKTDSLGGEKANEQPILEDDNKNVSRGTLEAKEDEPKEDEAGEAGTNLEIKTEEKPKTDDIDIRKELKVLRQQNLELQKKVSTFSEKYTKDRKKILEGEKQQIIQQQKDALDDEEWTRLENKRGEIDKEIYSVSAKTPASQQPNNPTLIAWANNNEWFYKDRVLGAYAAEIDNQIAEKSPYLSIEDRLSEVERQVKSRFPEKFGIKSQESPKSNNRRVITQNGQKVGISLGNTKTQKFADLPESAKIAYFQTCKVDGMTEEKYTKTYYE